jgi:hypothetical protein
LLILSAVVNEKNHFEQTAGTAVEGEYKGSWPRAIVIIAQNKKSSI